MSLNTLQQSLAERHRAAIIQIFEDYIREPKVALYLFGSRAHGTAHQASDIDLAVKGEASGPLLAKIRAALHESHIPYKIDLVDWNIADETLKKTITKNGILMWQN